MNAPTDQQLLREYAARRSEAAFKELVLRHIGFVHSAALRIVRNPHTAEDVTQAVFASLSKDAGSLSSHPVIVGWLHRTTRHLSANTVRAEARRRSREQQAISMNEQTVSGAEGDPSWSDIAPHLDAVLGELSDADRSAVILRFFEKRSAKEIAAQFGISAESAQKRVNRAVERLRELFFRRGVTSSGVMLTTAIESHAIQAVSANLAPAIAARILASQAVTTVSTGILTGMLQKVLAPVAAVLLAGIWVHQNHEADRLRAGAASVLPLPGAGHSASFVSEVDSGYVLPVQTGGGVRDDAEQGGGGFSVAAGVSVDGEWDGFDMDTELTSLDNLGRPTTDAVEKLELTDEELTALEAAVLRTREEAMEDFVSRVKLTKSGEEGDTYHLYYAVPARADRGQCFFDALAKGFVAALGESRGKRLREAMEEDDFLGGMGKYDLEFDFRGTSSRNIHSVKSVFREPGSAEVVRTWESSIDHFESNFGDVFDLPEEAPTYPKTPIRSLFPR